MIKQQWTLEESYIFSNSSHLERRVGLSNTILKGIHSHTKTIPARFNLIWFSGFMREDLNEKAYNVWRKDDQYEVMAKAQRLGELKIAIWKANGSWYWQSRCQGFLLWVVFWLIIEHNQQTSFSRGLYPSADKLCPIPIPQGSLSVDNSVKNSNTIQTLSLDLTLIHC